SALAINSNAAIDSDLIAILPDAFRIALDAEVGCRRARDFVGVAASLKESVVGRFRLGNRVASPTRPAQPESSVRSCRAVGQALGRVWGPAQSRVGASAAYLYWVKDVFWACPGRASGASEEPGSRGDRS